MKRFAWIVFFFLSALGVLCQKPSPALLLKVADSFMSQNFPGDTRPVSSWQPVLIDSITTFFVLNLEPEGWILMSADTRAEPVLGFSLTGHYTDPEKNPDHPGYVWVNQYYEQIKRIINEKDSAVNPAWKDTADISGLKNVQKNDTRVNILIDVNWGQGKTYNQFCPVDPAGPDGHVYVGCVAVSQAQAMSVFGVPEQGTGSHSYLATGYGTQFVNFGDTYYKWDSISTSSPDKYNALLLYHCAVSENMIFGAEGSGTQTSYASSSLKKYFNYSQHISYIMRLQDDQEWINLIDEQLLKGLPVIYTGDADDGEPGHAFNIDGVINGYYHINWGWDGKNNGYFTINSLRPGDYDFTKNHAAVIGIQPFYYPTDIRISDSVVKINVPPGDIVGIISVVDEAIDNTYSLTLAADSTLIGNSWIKDYYLDGDSVKTGRVFTNADNLIDSVSISLTDQFNNTLNKKMVLWVGAPPTGFTFPEEDCKNYFTIFPNPASDHIYIQNKSNMDIISIRIYTMPGTLIKSIYDPVSEDGIQLNAIKRGFYILEAELENQGLIHRKFIVQ